ncbi:MAG: nucleotide sugar dehydrogenase [Planctomycetes bacterium]|nr:nucleotide sugar dehydrogenase [Planctomycetota bacterium]
MTASDPATVLRERLDARTATIGIVGLGYVGLPLARAVHDAGFGVVGFDTDETKIDLLGRGENYLRHLGQELTQGLAESDRFSATADPGDLAEADAVLLCVPTPLGAHRDPDLSYVVNSARMIAKVLRRGQLVVLESTTYPGTTRDVVLPILAESGLRCGTDFFLAYSPEREDPGREGVTTATIPKLVGGVDEISGDLAMALYESVVTEAHRVNTAEIAEAAKLLENIYRAVNIAMVNEMKTLLDEMGLDVWEVIEAASTKPFGFQPFYPGPGLGGHCIPIDPFYLAWKAREVGRSAKFIELAGEINSRMPEYVIGRLGSALNEEQKSLRGSRILVLGVAYKPDVDDMRESPAAEIIERLSDEGAIVCYHDPHVERLSHMRHYDLDLSSTPLTEETIRGQDCVVIVTNHTAIDYGLIGRAASLIVDTRNAMTSVDGVTARVVKA